jgi:hypothetical protein
MSKTRANRAAPTGLSAANVERLLLADTTNAKRRRAEAAQARKAEAAQAKAAKQAEADAKRVTEAAEAADTSATEAADALRAQRVDFDALFESGTIPPTTSFADYLASQGFNPDGTPSKAHDAKTPYSGPMCALKAARKTYVKAANGILCNGSPLALLCGQHKREVVVAALIAALDLPGNPYLTLNPGQQSMNLRNKARHAISEGRLSLNRVEAELKLAAEQAA